MKVKNVTNERQVLEVDGSQYLFMPNEELDIPSEKTVSLPETIFQQGKSK